MKIIFTCWTSFASFSCFIQPTINFNYKSRMLDALLVKHSAPHTHSNWITFSLTKKKTSSLVCCLSTSEMVSLSSETFWLSCRIEIRKSLAAILSIFLGLRVRQFFTARFLFYFITQFFSRNFQIFTNSLQRVLEPTLK